jgi:hypothetical protein
MLTETSATLYNAVTEKGSGWITYHRTVIPTVHWEDRRTAGGSGTSHPSQNGISVFIPFSTDDFMPTDYVQPEDYAKMREEGITHIWTLAPGDLLLKGTVQDEIGETMSIKEFMSRHHETVTIQAVETVDYGSYAMRHWEVTAT